MIANLSSQCRPAVPQHRLIPHLQHQTHLHQPATALLKRFRVCDEQEEPDTSSVPAAASLTALAEHSPSGSRPSVCGSLTRLRSCLQTIGSSKFFRKGFLQRKVAPQRQTHRSRARPYQAVETTRLTDPFRGLTTSRGSVHVDVPKGVEEGCLCVHALGPVRLV